MVGKWVLFSLKYLPLNFLSPLNWQSKSILIATDPYNLTTLFSIMLELRLHDILGPVGL